MIKKSRSLGHILVALLLLGAGACHEYVETDAEEIKFEVNLPQYWEEYFDKKHDLLLKANQKIADNGVSFIFITDVHVGSNNMMSPLLIKHLVKNNYMNKLVCGGDIISGCQDSKEKAFSELSSWAKAINPIPAVTILGNHDLNSNDQKNSSHIISEKDFFNELCGVSNSFVNYVDGELYGYEDDASQMTRYIYLNTKAPDSAVIDEVQILWLKDRVLELGSDWTVIVFCHQFWTGVSSSVKTLNMDANGVLIENALNEVFDKADATIACVIAGHCHRNYSKYSSKSYPIIATTCDTGGAVCQDYDPDTPCRISGTTTEQAFDLYYINTTDRHISVIRIGAGDSVMDRDFTY